MVTARSSRRAQLRRPACRVRRISMMTLALLLAFPLIADEPTPPVSQEDQRTTLAVEALTRLQNVDLSQNAKLKEAVYKLLEKTRGTANYVKLVQYFKIPNQDRGLLDVALRNSTNETGVAAIRSILANNDFSVLAESLRGTNSDQARQTAELLGNATDKNSVTLLSPLVANQKLDVRVRREAVRSLAKTQEGAITVVNLAKAEKLPEDLKLVAATELNRTRWPEIKQQASEVLPLPAGQNSQPLPSISELVKMKGD